MIHRRRPYLLLIAAIASGALAACDTENSPAAATQVHISGYAYRFAPGATEIIAGASIGVAELPALSTKTDAAGFYMLTVPDGAKISPTIKAEGYHAMQLQTFTTAGKDLKNVHFQTPDDGIYIALASLVGAKDTADSCNIASTVNTKAIHDLTYQQFRAFGAHGVADATVTGTPALPPTVYFDEQTVPSPKWTTTSSDGGVLWTQVPKGTYTLTAHHPAKKFATVVVTCTGGQLINANPPWGLYEL